MEINNNTIEEKQIRTFRLNNFLKNKFKVKSAANSNIKIKGGYILILSLRSPSNNKTKALWNPQIGQS